VILPDVNVLIYAFRSDSPDHDRCRDWLESVVNGPEAYAMSPQVLASFVRICTHPRIYARPSRARDAFVFANTLLGQPTANLVVPGERHWSIFESLCGDAGAAGNLVQDAWFAALAIEAGCEWITVDRDYARFTGLRWRTPW
jgi:toxin-antitoxin system PIN domain toxin